MKLTLVVADNLHRANHYIVNNFTIGERSRVRAVMSPMYLRGHSDVQIHVVDLTRLSDQFVRELMVLQQFGCDINFGDWDSYERHDR